MKERRHNQRILSILLAVVIVWTILPVSQVFARTRHFEKISLTVDVPEDIIVVSTELSDYDPAWKEADIANPKDWKSESEDLGRIASFYKKETATYVELYSKSSETSRDMYNLSELTAKEQADFINGLSSDTQENEKIAATSYKKEGYPFYRLDVKADSMGKKVHEVAYGTIANGLAVWFDTHVYNDASLDEDFIKQLVDGSEFTKITLKADALQQQKDAAKFLIIALVICVLIIIGLVFFFRYRSKKKQEKQKKLNAQIEQFRLAHRKDKENGKKDSLLYKNVTEYTSDVMWDYIKYDEVTRNIPIFTVTGALLLGMTIYFLKFSESRFSAIFMIIVVGIYCYMQFIAMERKKQMIYKRYETPEKNTIQFYDEYFNVHRIGSDMEYPYIQVCRIRENKEYLYIYVGIGVAVYVKKDGFEVGEYEQFLTFLKEKVTKK